MLAHPLAVVAMLTSATLATGAIALTYTTPSSVTTGVVAPPVQFGAGADAGPSTLSDYVTAYALSTNKTYVTSTLKGVPEASVTIDSFTTVTNVDDASRTVTLSTTQVTNAFVTAYTVRFYDATDTLQGTLDLRASSPSVTFALPAGATYRAAVALTLGPGAGADNVALTNSVSLAVA